jgi:hypothetical protein
MPVTPTIDRWLVLLLYYYRNQGHHRRTNDQRCQWKGRHPITQNRPKANYVERVQRTIKTTIYRLMKHRRNYRYIDDLDQIVTSYNATPHKSLNYLAPKAVNKDNEAESSGEHLILQTHLKLVLHGIVQHFVLYYTIVKSKSFFNQIRVSY